MDHLLELVPEERHGELEIYLLGLVAKIRKQRNLRAMSEVCSRNAALHDTYKTIAKRLAHLPESEAIFSMMASIKNADRERCVANLQLARKRLKRDLAAKRNQEIALLVRDGCSNAEIAARTGLSLSTVARKAPKAIKGERL